MKSILNKIKKFHNDENGDIVQTGIIIGILATIAVGALVILGPKITALFTKGGAALDKAQTEGTLN